MAERNPFANPGEQGSFARQASSLGEKIQEEAQSLTEKAKETAASIGEQARGVASNVAGQARDVASSVKNQAQDLASTVGHKAEDIFEDLTGLIRRYPMQSLLVGFGVGFLIAQAFRARD